MKLECCICHSRAAGLIRDEESSLYVCAACLFRKIATFQAELSVARSSIAGLMEQKAALMESATYTQNGKTASAMGWATICATLEAEAERLRSRLAEEIRYGHRHCTRGNCCSSGIDCPEQVVVQEKKPWSVR